MAPRATTIDAAHNSHGWQCAQRSAFTVWPKLEHTGAGREWQSRQARPLTCSTSAAPAQWCGTQASPLKPQLRQRQQQLLARPAATAAASANTRSSARPVVPATTTGCWPAAMQAYVGLQSCHLRLCKPLRRKPGHADAAQKPAPTSPHGWRAQRYMQRTHLPNSMPHTRQS